MMFEANIEKKIESNKKTLSLLQMKLERFEKAFKHLYEEMNVTPEQLSGYLETADNFEPHIWDHLEAFREELNQRMRKELDNIRNPLKTSKTYEERKNIQQHWLFVR